MDRLLAYVAVEERVRVYKLPPGIRCLFYIAYSTCMGVDVSTMQGGSRYSELSLITAYNKYKGSQQE